MTSYYEITHPLAKLRGSHFIDHFDGGSLRAWWSTINLGNGTLAMADEVDGGLRMATSTTTGNGDWKIIKFNNIRSFSNTGCVFIANFKFSNGATTDAWRVIMANEATNLVINDFFGWKFFNPDTNFSFQSMNASTVNSVASTVSADSSFHNFSGIINSTTVRGYLDGNLECISTSNLPTARLQPVVEVWSSTTHSVANEARIKYMECFNL